MGLFRHKAPGGRRGSFEFGTNTNITLQTSEVLLRQNGVNPTASQPGYVMPRNGSIIGISGFIETSTVTVSGNILIRAKTGPASSLVNSLASPTTLVDTGAGGKFKFRATATVGTWPVIAGEYVGCVWLGDGSTNILTDNYLGMIEIQWDN